MANPIVLASALSSAKLHTREPVCSHRRGGTILGIILIIFVMVLTLVLVFQSQSNVTVVPLYISRKSWLPELVDRFNADFQNTLNVRFECYETVDPPPAFDAAYSPDFTAQIHLLNNGSVYKIQESSCVSITNIPVGWAINRHFESDKTEIIYFDELLSKINKLGHVDPHSPFGKLSFLSEVEGCKLNSTCLRQLYGKISKIVSERLALFFILDQFDAVTLDESSVISWNLKKQNVSLSFVYEPNGMYALDNPICFTEDATDFTKKMTQKLQEYLLQEDQQKLMIEMGVRPVNSSIIVSGSPFNVENGVNSDLLVPIKQIGAIDDENLMDLWYSLQTQTL